MLETQNALTLRDDRERNWWWKAHIIITESAHIASNSDWWFGYFGRNIVLLKSIRYFFYEWTAEYTSVITTLCLWEERETFQMLFDDAAADDTHQLYEIKLDSIKDSNRQINAHLWWILFKWNFRKFNKLFHSNPFLLHPLTFLTFSTSHRRGRFSLNNIEREHMSKKNVLLVLRLKNGRKKISLISFLWSIRRCCSLNGISGSFWLSINIIIIAPRSYNGLFDFILIEIFAMSYNVIKIGFFFSLCAQRSLKITSWKTNHLIYSVKWFSF